MSLSYGTIRFNCRACVIISIILPRDLFSLVMFSADFLYFYMFNLEAWRVLLPYYMQAVRVTHVSLFILYSSDASFQGVYFGVAHIYMAICFLKREGLATQQLKDRDIALLFSGLSFSL